MLGMFLNKKDAEALGQSIHEGTMEAARRNSRSLRESMAARLSFEDIIAGRDETIAQLSAEVNSYVETIRALVDTTKPEVREKLRYLRSRHLDSELDQLLANGRLSADPRLDADWCASSNYRRA